MTSILFLFDGVKTKPSGGAKVVYEYANRFAKDGYDVTIVYSSLREPTKRLPFLLKAIVRYIYYLINRRYKCCNWFHLDNRIKLKMVYSLDSKFVPRADCYVATAIQTAYFLDKYDIDNNRKIYLIQGYENWYGNDDVVLASYRFRIKKLVISKWLFDIVQQYDDSVQLMKNGFDFNFFTKTIEPELKNKFCVSMLYHKMKRKGCEDGFRALSIVKKRFPQLTVNLFGTPNRPEYLPEWYHYFQSPDKETFNRVYNESCIYLGTSLSEGWGLTIGEAMMCGVAVVCTDNLGYKELATNNDTAIVVPVGYYDAMANSIIELILNDNLRFRIAKAGYSYIQSFTWDSSYSIFKATVDSSFC